jgi:hypothetical protein
MRGASQHELNASSPGGSDFHAFWPSRSVQNVFLALLERALVEPPRAVCAVQWLLDRVALFAQPDLAA